MANNRWHKMPNEGALQLALRDIQIRALERARHALEKEQAMICWYDTKDADRERKARHEMAIESQKLNREWQ